MKHGLTCQIRNQDYVQPVRSSRNLKGEEPLWLHAKSWHNPQLWVFHPIPSPEMNPVSLHTVIKNDLFTFTNNQKFVKHRGYVTANEKERNTSIAGEEWKCTKY